MLTINTVYIFFLFERRKKKKKIKTPSFDFDDTSILDDHSLPNERTPHTPRHEPYQPTRNEPPDKNRSGGGVFVPLLTPLRFYDHHSDEVTMKG